MFVILGFIAVLGAIFGGYALAGGHLGALWQPVELLMIGGGAVGAFIVGNNAKAIKATLRALPDAFRGSRYTKALYMDLLAMLYEILSKVRRDGIMSIENDIENPEASSLFTKYPRVLADRHLVDFLTDYLRLMVSGNLDAYQIENLMDNEIETHHMEGHVPVHCIARMGDGLPAFGIIAAVMGVVHTMENVALPPARWSAPSSASCSPTA
jgi:chemotaxis protein MotA